MSQNDPSKTPTSTNIKIAAKDASQRASGAADPGPGDISAAPSEAPQLVDIPEPPTASQLVVKSTSKHSTQHGSSRTANTSLGNSGHSGRAHTGSVHTGSFHTGSAHSVGAGASGSQSHSGPKSVIMASLKHSAVGNSQMASQMGPAASNQTEGAPKEPTSSKNLSGPSGPKSTGSSNGGLKSTSSANAGPKSASSQASAGVSTGPGLSAAAAGPSSEPGAVHDVDEEGEGEVTQPEDGTASPSSPVGGLRGSSAISGPSAAPLPDAASGVSGKSSAVSSPKQSSPTISTSSDHKPHRNGKNKKKITRFRYHKRVTVRTTGKTSPSTIMSKVNKKDHKAGITPSTIEDMDPQELMKRAGIKGSQQAHWRIRLRQTKRLTKNGQTTTQTKVAYRDSEGNKRVKTSSSPFCKNCGKKLEECKCDSTSQS